MLLMGKSTISTGSFSIAMLNYQRVIRNVKKMTPAGFVQHFHDFIVISQEIMVTICDYETLFL